MNEPVSIADGAVVGRHGQIPVRHYRRRPGRERSASIVVWPHGRAGIRSRFLNRRGTTALDDAIGRATQWLARTIRTESLDGALPALRPDR